MSTGEGVQKSLSSYSGMEKVPYNGKTLRTQSVQLLKKFKIGIQMYNHKRKTPGAK